MATGIAHPRDVPVDTSRLKSVRMGTTVATNALLQHAGQPTALLITRGFGDLLRIGNQSRPNIFQLDIEEPHLLYEHVIQIDERFLFI